MSAKNVFICSVKRYRPFWSWFFWMKTANCFLCFLNWIKDRPKKTWTAGVQRHEQQSIAIALLIVHRSFLQCIFKTLKNVGAKQKNRNCLDKKVSAIIFLSGQVAILKVVEALPTYVFGKESVILTNSINPCAVLLLSKHYSNLRLLAMLLSNIRFNDSINKSE